MSGDGSEKDERPSGKLHTADTVPPPASGDAYNAATEIRQAPDDLLDIMREVKEARAVKQAAKAAGGGPEVLRVPKAPLVPAILGLRPPAAGAPAVATPAPAAPPPEPAPVARQEPVVAAAAPVEIPPVAAPEIEAAPAALALAASARPAAVVPASVDDSPLEYPGTARRQRNRKTAVAVLSILVVVAVVLAAITVVLGLKGGAAT